MSRRQKRKDREANPENLDLAFNLGKAHNCIDISSTDKFDGYFLTPLDMDAKLDLAKLTLTEGLEEKVRTKTGDISAWMSCHIGLNSRVVEDIRIRRILRRLFLVVRSGNRVRRTLLPAGICRLRGLGLDSNRNSTRTGRGHG